MENAPEKAAIAANSKFRSACALLAWALAVGALGAVAPTATPAQAQNQSNRPIVMVCHGDRPGQVTYIIDLAANTVVIDMFDAVPPAYHSKSTGTVVSKTDSEIVMMRYGADGKYEYRDTLNRYSGIIMFEPVAAELLAAGVPPGSAQCQRQERQV